MEEIRRSPVDMVNIPLFTMVFSTIPGGDRRISEPIFKLQVQEVPLQRRRSDDLLEAQDEMSHAPPEI